MASFALPNKYSKKSKGSSDKDKDDKDKSSSKKDDNFGSVYQAMTGFLNRMSIGDGNNQALPKSLSNIPSFRAAHKFFMAERERLNQQC